MHIFQCLKASLIVALFAVFTSCNKPDPTKFLGTALDPHYDAAKVDTTKYNTEYLLYNTVKLNGVLPLESSYKEFLKVVGQPDSLVNNKDDECQFFEELYQYIYFQESMFFLVNDTAIFQNIDFRSSPDLELTSPAIKLNRHTTLTEIQRLYPKAASKIKVADYIEGSTLQFVTLEVSRLFLDARWCLYFEHDKLVKVELYMQC